MRLKYDLIVLDLETNQPSDKIIELGAVRVSRNLKCLDVNDSFTSLAQLDEKLNPEVSKLTGIKEKDLKKAPKLAQVFKKFSSWAFRDTKNIVLASWSPYDVVQLQAQDPNYPFRRKMLDIKSMVIMASLLANKKTHKCEGGLKAFSELWHCVGPNFQPHRALDDAIQTADLFLTTINYFQSMYVVLDSMTKGTY